jgi:hypothetical protein
VLGTKAEFASIRCARAAMNIDNVGTAVIQPRLGNGRDRPLVAVELGAANDGNVATTLSSSISRTWIARIATISKHAV